MSSWSSARRKSISSIDLRRGGVAVRVGVEPPDRTGFRRLGINQGGAAPAEQAGGIASRAREAATPTLLPMMTGTPDKKGFASASTS
jgi:hypothetical protein